MNHKQYVSVDANFDIDGKIRPLCVVWEDGAKYPIDYVLDVRPCASLKAGGAGIRYQCRIGGHIRYL